MAKIALLIGVSEYESGLTPLPAAIKDLDAIQEVLLDPEIGGFAETDVTLLKNPTRQVMEEAIYTLFSSRHRDDLLLLFFSGHGIKDDSGTLYLATRSTRKTQQGELITPTAVSASFVHSRMSRSRSKRQVVILDSCFSGAFAEGLSAKDDGNIDIFKQLGGEGRAVLTSSSSTQYSFEEEGEELSLYTRFLIEGIKTGKADLDEDDVISVDELHEYARRKVQGIKPEVKPELYAIREGFKIRLLKVPQGDPRQKYRREVARCGTRGELTIVSRSILDTWRVRLGLTVEEAKSLEDEVLGPYRQAFQQKLCQYENVITEIFTRDGVISDDTRQELRNLQRVLELRNEDTIPIEARVSNAFKTRQKNLEAYRELFLYAVKQEYPLGDAVRLHLQQSRQNLGLSEADVAAIERQVVADFQDYRRNLRKYEEALLAATQQEYPLPKNKRDELQQYQQTLGLADIDIAPIEAKINTQVETYQQKILQYKDAVISVTQRRYRLSEAERLQLNQTWQNLGLSEADAKSIESPILSQVEEYQLNLRRYEQAFLNETERQYPLGDEALHRLAQSKQSLRLTDEDAARIQTQIITSIDQRLEKMQQYEQVFSDSIRYEFPVSGDSRKELNRFQRVLALSDKEIEHIETNVVERRERTKNENEPAVLQVESRQSQERQLQSQLEVPAQRIKIPYSASTVSLSHSSNDESSRTSSSFSSSTHSLSQVVKIGCTSISCLFLVLGVVYSLLPGLREQFSETSEKPALSVPETVTTRPLPALSLGSYLRILSTDGLGIRSETTEGISIPQQVVLYPTLEAGLEQSPDALTGVILVGGIVSIIEKTASPGGSEWVQVQLCSLPFGDELVDSSTKPDSSFNQPGSIDPDQPLVIEPGQTGWIQASELAAVTQSLSEVFPSQQGRCEG